MKASHQSKRSLEKNSDQYYKNKKKINPSCACHIYFIKSIISFYLLIFELRIQRCQPTILTSRPSFALLTNERFIDGVFSFAHAPVNVTDFSIVSINCATFSASVNINYRLPIKVYHPICSLKHIRIEINHGSQNVFELQHVLADISKFYTPIHIKTQNTFWLP